MRLIINFNQDALHDDLRKIGIGALLAGIVGMVINQVSLLNGLLAIIIGTMFWVAGLVTVEDCTNG